MDTSFLIDVLRARKDRRAYLAEQIQQGQQLCTSVINIAEVYVGMRPTERAETEVFLNSLHCFFLTPAIARRAGSLKGLFAAQGKTLALPDMLVAATALEHNIELVTDNRKDFPLPELRLHTLP